MQWSPPIPIFSISIYCTACKKVFNYLKVIVPEMNKDVCMDQMINGWLELYKYTWKGFTHTH